MGLRLFTGHPGTVWRTDPQHVQVRWVGLDNEPATYALGFSMNEETQLVPGLGLLSVATFRSREQALMSALKARTLSDEPEAPWK